MLTLEDIRIIKKLIKCESAYEIEDDASTVMNKIESFVPVKEPTT